MGIIAPFEQTEIIAQTPMGRPSAIAWRCLCPREAKIARDNAAAGPIEACDETALSSQAGDNMNAAPV